MEKIDLKKQYKAFYSAKAEPKIVEVPELKYIAFDGEGNPGSKDFEEAMGVLYGLAYTIKFMCKADDRDFTVMPLEGTWWSENIDDFVNGNKDNWKWTVMIAVPEFVTEELFEKGRASLSAKKDVPQLERGYLSNFNDGLAAQLMHIGPYSEETENIQKLHRFVEEQGYKLVKKHREIYISSPQRTAPEKLKTIIRHPIEKIS